MNGSRPRKGGEVVETGERNRVIFGGKYELNTKDFMFRC